MRITFLGTGTSHGIPTIGCRCRVCMSPNPLNRRNRLGVWIRDANQSTLIDVSPEFRMASLRYGISEIDYVLLTHAHADHTAGMDDLRVFSQRSRGPLPIHGNAHTLADVKSRYRYAFRPPLPHGGGIPQFALREVTGDIPAGDWKIVPLPVLHGPLPILGYRINDFALITDVTVIPDSTLERMRGLDILALDCLRMRPHSTHLCLSQSVAYAKRIGARRTYFIHMTHELEHEETQSILPENMYMSYDGLELESPER